MAVCVKIYILLKCDAVYIGRYIFIYLINLTSIGLTPGGSSTVHIYTQTAQNTEHGTYTTIKEEKMGSAGRATPLRILPWHLP
jgi:hypothetical protein